MSAQIHTHDIVNRGAGTLWHQLHAEREAICEALLKPYPKLNGQKLSGGDLRQTANWHRNLLQERLTKVDNALDRLLSGSYGDCCNCGRWIEDTKLQLDPAIAYCFECWQRRQSTH